MPREIGMGGRMLVVGAALVGRHDRIEAFGIEIDEPHLAAPPALSASTVASRTAAQKLSGTGWQ